MGRHQLDGDYRNPGLMLMTALYAAPLVFYWLTLRAGYRPGFRRAVFAYTGFVTAMGVIARLG